MKKEKIEKEIKYLKMNINERAKINEFADADIDGKVDDFISKFMATSNGTKLLREVDINSAAFRKAVSIYFDYPTENDYYDIDDPDFIRESISSYIQKSLKGDGEAITKSKDIECYLDDFYKTQYLGIKHEHIPRIPKNYETKLYLRSVFSTKFTNKQSLEIQKAFIKYILDKYPNAELHKNRNRTGRLFYHPFYFKSH